MIHTLSKNGTVSALMRQQDREKLLWMALWKEPVIIIRVILFCSALNTLIVSVEITNKMQPCNIIYYSTVHWRLNMFRAGYRSSSGALTVFAASGLHTHVVTGRSQVWPVPTQTWLRSVTTCVYKPEAVNKVRASDDERYAAGNMLSLQWTVE